MEQLSFDDLETWRPIAGWEGLYEVSDRGRVRSLPRNKRRGRGIWLDPGRVLQPGVSRYGHLRVNLQIDDVFNTRLVHQLVAETFIGPRPDGMEIRHLDGNAGNNVVGNIVYGTSSENNYDLVRHGTHNNARKTHCANDHEYTAENTYIRPNGGRDCRICRRDRIRRFKQKARQQRAADLMNRSAA